MQGKIVVLGKKKLIFTLAVLLGVVVPLMAVSYYAPVEDVAGKVYDAVTYSSEGQGISFNYPQGWLIRVEKDYSGGEILEHVSFRSPDRAAHGFVQVMKLNQGIPEYVQEAKKSMTPGYDSLKFKKTNVGDRTGFVLSYRRGSGDARMTALEYFFSKDGKIYRFSCFYPEKMDDRYAVTFGEMLASFTF